MSSKKKLSFYKFWYSKYHSNISTIDNHHNCAYKTCRKYGIIARIPNYKQFKL